MCGGGGIGRLVKKVMNVTTGGLAGKLLEDVVGGQVGGVPQAPQAPTIQEQQAKAEQTVKEAEGKAAALAQEKDLKRRKAIAKGGRQSTILAGRQATSDKKTTLGG
jgi:hypothetical protein